MQQHIYNTEYSQCFSSLNHSPGPTLTSSKSTPATVNKIRMASPLPLIGKYESLYLDIAQRNGEGPLFERTTELGNLTLRIIGATC